LPNVTPLAATRRRAILADVEGAAGRDFTEEFLTEFLSLLGRVDRRFAARSAELMQTPAWSEVTWTLDVGEMNADHPDRYLAITGVDGELEDVGGVAWQLEIGRRGAGWEVERELTLNANDASEQTTVSTLPVLTFEDSRVRLPGSAHASYFPQTATGRGAGCPGERDGCQEPGTWTAAGVAAM
jgi:hypothetical protein